MAFKQTATLLGFDRTFKVNELCKPYTLRDNGFVKTPSGNFQYRRSLDVTSRAGLVLRVMVNKDLKTLKISTVNEKGLNTVNVSKLDDNDMIVEKINFIFDGFVERNVLEEIK